MKNKVTFRIVGLTAFILALPLLAMQFTDQVNWDLFDFAIAALLLLSTGFAYWIIAQNINHASSKAIVGAVILLALVLLWMELAVGIFGSPFAGS